LIVSKNQKTTINENYVVFGVWNGNNVLLPATKKSYLL